MSNILRLIVFMHNEAHEEDKSVDYAEKWSLCTTANVETDYRKMDMYCKQRQISTESKRIGKWNSPDKEPLGVNGILMNEANAQDDSREITQIERVVYFIRRWEQMGHTLLVHLHCSANNRMDDTKVLW